MYIDQNLLFADTVTTTLSAASTDYLDSKVITIKDGDAYKAMWWVVKTESTAAVAGNGAPTATFQLQTSEDAAFLDSTTITLASTGANLAAALTANTIISRMRIPLGLKRYTRVYNVVDSGLDAKRFSAISWSSFFATDVGANLP